MAKRISYALIVLGLGIAAVAATGCPGASCSYQAKDGVERQQRCSSDF